jgi:hypothetical protein
VKSFRLLQWGVALGISLIPAAWGQTIQVIRVDVPFGFHVGDKEFPAGEYTVNGNSAPGVLLIRSSDYKRAQFFLTQSEMARNSNVQTSLVFRRYGEDYFLSSVWVSGSGTGRYLPPGKQEKEMAHMWDSPPRQIIVTALRRPKR